MLSKWNALRSDDETHRKQRHNQHKRIRMASTLIAELSADSTHPPHWPH
jgi:hypothetical protein